MTQKHQGGCHCKAVRYEVELDLEQPVFECNCSHCQIKGTLWQFVPAEQFTLISGDDVLTEYRFNTQKLAHKFCSVCGVESFAYGEQNGTPTRAINVRTIDDIDLDALTRKKVNGKDF
ncbi:MAG TPA: GFA family protein [Candidatus Paceibacterota bacterium]|nr:GFA family protein [Candidatus Paceibacterota bacterium]